MLFNLWFEKSPFVNITIYYERPETDEEVKIREIEEQKEKDNIKAKEIYILKELKQKYNDI